MLRLRVRAASLYLTLARVLRAPQRVVDHAMDTLSRETIRDWYARARRAVG